MKCPFCGFNSNKVLDKRETEDLGVTRRRRECEKCNKRFTTYERVENLDLSIIKKDGRKEQFDREKLKKGLLKACEKRNVPDEKIDKIVDMIETRLKLSRKKEVPTSFIGEKVMNALKRVDNVAYIRFASVYREFKDVEDFKKEIKQLK